MKDQWLQEAVNAGTTRETPWGRWCSQVRSSRGEGEGIEREEDGVDDMGGERTRDRGQSSWRGGTPGRSEAAVGNERVAVDGAARGGTRACRHRTAAASW